MSRLADTTAYQAERLLHVLVLVGAPVALGAAAIYQSRPAAAIGGAASPLELTVQEATQARHLQFYVPVKSPPAEGALSTHGEVPSPQTAVEDRQRPASTPPPSPPPPPAIKVAIREQQPSRLGQQGCAAGYAETVDQVSAYFQLEPQLVLAVIESESNCDEGALSHAGAHGLMQLIPEAGARDAYRHLFGQKGTPTVEALNDPEINIWLGGSYLSALREEFAYIKNPEAQLRLMVAAYNWGPSRVRSAIDDLGIPPDAQSAEWLVGKRAPKETRDYLARVLRRRDRWHDRPVQDTAIAAGYASRHHKPVEGARVPSASVARRGTPSTASLPPNVDFIMVLDPADYFAGIRPNKP